MGAQAKFSNHDGLHARDRRLPAVRRVRAQPPARDRVRVRPLHRRARHPSRDHRPRRLVGERARGGALLQGLPPEGQRAAEPPRRGRLQRRVRRDPRDHPARRQDLRALPLLAGAQAGVRHRRRGRPAPRLEPRSPRDRRRDQARLPRARRSSSRRGSGRDGNRFTMLKFRTMRNGAEERARRARAQNETAGLFKLRRRPARDPRSGDTCAAPRSTSFRSSSTCCAAR